MRVNEKFSKKLLVEGNDDQHVIWALCEKFSLPETFDVIDCEGIDKLYKQIPLRFKQSGVDTIGIIIDADIEIKNRWTELINIFTNQGFILPENLSSNGLVISNGNDFKIGVWIMPNNSLNGMLEDFISFLVPKEDKLLPIAQATLNSIEKQKLNKYSLEHRSKAVIHSWLSWQENPGTPMGLAITKRFLTTDTKICLNITNWLIKLFN